MIKEIPRIVRQLPDGATAMYAWFQAMHTRVDILLRHTGPAACDLMQRVINQMQQEIFELECVGNCFSPSSEISRLNNLSAGKRIKLSPILHDILSKCQYYHSITDGLFDISISSSHHTPHTFHYLKLHEDHTASKEDKFLVLNLSGFLKGYALDRMKAILEYHKLSDALLNMGNSSILSMGDVPFHIKNSCLTTSGNSAINPRHIINPKTGEYVTTEKKVSVVTDTGTNGEVASTVMLLCETGNRKAMMENLNVKDVIG
ncbi:MAG: FAD:protein FMN transferase [Muribaculaceae bacterium]|nr:FAD:protein FMN transferase [Muribaculaceae bacterium]